MLDKRTAFSLSFVLLLSKDIPRYALRCFMADGRFVNVVLQAAQ